VRINVLSFEDSCDQEWELSNSVFEVSLHDLNESSTTHLGGVIARKDMTLRKQGEESLKELNGIKTKPSTVIRHNFQGNTAAVMVVAQGLIVNSERRSTEERLLTYRNREGVDEEFAFGKIRSRFYQASQELWRARA